MPGFAASVRAAHDLSLHELPSLSWSCFEMWVWVKNKKKQKKQKTQKPKNPKSKPLVFSFLGDEKATSTSLFYRRYTTLPRFSPF